MSLMSVRDLVTYMLDRVLGVAVAKFVENDKPPHLHDFELKARGVKTYIFLVGRGPSAAHDIANTKLISIIQH